MLDILLKVRDLILETKDTSLTIVINAKTDALPKGDLHLAWKKLEMRWDPKSREDKIDSLTKFIQLKMENIQIKPQDWMAHMKNELENAELENAGHEMDDETVLTHVIASLILFYLLPSIEHLLPHQIHLCL